MTRSLAISIALHGIAVLLLLWVAGRMVAPAPAPARALVSVDLVTPAPPQVPALPTARSTPPHPAQVSPGRKSKSPPSDATVAAATTTSAKPSPARPEKSPDGAGVPAGTPGRGAVMVSVQGGSGDPRAGGAAPAGGGKAGHGPGIDAAGPGGPDFGAAYTEIRALVEKVARRSYPPKARRLGMEGIAVVRFMVGRSGAPEGAGIVAGSGYQALDEAALEIIRNAGPYPYVPEPVQIPIRFSLDR